MGWDLFGQLIGKNRRRQLESDAAKVVKINWGVLGTRLAAGAAAGLLGATVHGSLPTTTGAILTAALGGLAAAGPSALSASGLVNAVSPTTISLAASVGSQISSILSAPSAVRQQQIEQIASQAALQAVQNWANTTGQFTRDQLAGNAPLPAGMAVSDPIPPAPAPAAIAGDGAAAIAGDGAAAILSTGGSQ